MRNVPSPKTIEEMKAGYDHLRKNHGGVTIGYADIERVLRASVAWEKLRKRVPALEHDPDKRWGMYAFSHHVVLEYIGESSVLSLCEKVDVFPSDELITKIMLVAQ
jgi:hypothetical protein